MDNIVLKLESVSKYYRLGVINNGTLRQDLKTWFALKTGKEDPNSKIGYNDEKNDEDGFWALNDINAEIHQGDRVGIIGKNGAGKSTLLKIISGITSPTHGNIKIKGRISSLLEVGTGFNPELTGRENIYLNGAILGMKKRDVDRKIDEIIAFSEIEKHIDTPVKRYSSGMYVRLAFAVAAHLDSEILIADEVLAVGDAAFQKKALGKMNELSSGYGKTVLFVSHNMSQIKKVCNKGMILNRGKLVRIDDDINESISYYLGIEKDGETSVKTKKWINDGSIKNKYFTPISILFFNKENEGISTAISYEEEFKIQLDVYIEELENIDFWFDLYRENERILMISGTDMIKKGSSSYVFKIPAKSLLPGKYIISLGSTIKNVQWIIDPSAYEVSTFFEIADAISPIFECNECN